MSNSDKLSTLKAWVHWVLLNPIDEDQKAHAEATNDLIIENEKLKHKITLYKDAFNAFTEAMTISNKVATESAKN